MDRRRHGARRGEQTSLLVTSRALCSHAWCAGPDSLSGIDCQAAYVRLGRESRVTIVVGKVARHMVRPSSWARRLSPGVFERGVQRDLERFKEYIESRGTETGAPRGSV
jgi:hypothetical protein